MKQLVIITVFIFSTLGNISCDRSNCTTENSIFKENTPKSKAYKNELAKQLKSIDKSKLTYWLQKHELLDGKESLYFYIQSDGLCAVLHLTMNHWGKLEVLRAKKGVSYRGAEFKNLTFEIRKDAISTDFIYTTFDRIID